MPGIAQRLRTTCRAGLTTTIIIVVSLCESLMAAPAVPAPPPEPRMPHAGCRPHSRGPLCARTEPRPRRPSGRRAQPGHPCGGCRARGPDWGSGEQSHRPRLGGARGGVAHLLRSAVAASQGAAGGVRASEGQKPPRGRRRGGGHPGGNRRRRADAAGGPGAHAGARGFRAAVGRAGVARSDAAGWTRRWPRAPAGTCRSQQTTRFCS
jgi:hypothetical protein